MGRYFGARLIHSLVLVVIISGYWGKGLAINGNPSRDSLDGNRPCLPRDFGRGSIVCVCNSTYCDTLAGTPSREATHQDEIHIFTSSKSGQRLHKSSIRFHRRINTASSTTPPDLPLSSSLREGKKRGTQEDQVAGGVKRKAEEEGEEARKRRQDDSNSNSNNGFKTKFEQQQSFFSNTREEDEDNTLNFPPVSLLEKLSSRNRISKFWVNRDVKYQTVMGFGGAFTDAAGLNMGLLSKETQENLMRSYFGPEGAEYSMCRVPMGGTDFSMRPYSYDSRGNSKEPDTNLTYFALQPEDLKLKIPYIQRAIELSEREVKLVASPWSAPVWMKTNDHLNGAGMLKREYYQVWADYFVRFLEEYKKQGIPIWGVTTGNEPFNGFVPFFPFNCMGWRASDIRDWIADHLGPTLKAKKGGKDENGSGGDWEDVRIIMFDDNKGGLPTWTKQILENNRSAQYVDGIGTHWYFDFLTGSAVLSRVHKKHPEVFIIQTEACLGFTPWESEKVIVGSWERGEAYLEAIIRDFKNWVGAWIDWNLALNMKGGPNWANLAADAAVIVNPETDEFFKQPIYYAMSHVSKFVTPGSVRIQLTGLRVPSRLHTMAFLRPDNATVILFLNRLSYGVKISLLDEGKGTIAHQVPARSTQTFVYYS